MFIILVYFINKPARVLVPTDVSYICFKNIAKLHIQANNLPKIRLNV